MKKLAYWFLITASLISPTISGAHPAAGMEEISEIHLQICGSDIQEAISRIRGEKLSVKEQWLKAKEMTVYYLDTPDLQYYRNGLVLRIREKGEDKIVFTVKLWPLTPSDLDTTWSSVDGLSCEHDLTLERELKDCSLDDEIGRHDWKRTIDGEISPLDLLSKTQVAFLNAFKPNQNPPQPKVLGPMYMKRWQVAWPELDSDLTLEHWMSGEEPRYGQLEILELSTRGSLGRAEMLRKQLIEGIRARGLSLCERQIGKTELALDYFTR